MAKSARESVHGIKDRSCAPCKCAMKSKQTSFEQLRCDDRRPLQLSRPLLSGDNQCYTTFCCKGCSSGVYTSHSQKVLLANDVFAVGHLRCCKECRSNTLVRHHRPLSPNCQPPGLPWVPLTTSSAVSCMCYSKDAACTCHPHLRTPMPWLPTRMAERQRRNALEAMCVTTETRHFSPERLAKGLVGAYNGRPRGDCKVPPLSLIHI